MKNDSAPLSDSPVRVALAAGGTGGHAFAALALGEELRARGAQCLWAGIEDGVEAECARQNGFEFAGVSFPAAARRSRRRPRYWTALARATAAARRGLRRRGTQIVVGFGGYASMPACLAAWTLRMPLVIFEQNARPGIANRALARFASRLLCAYPGAFGRRVAAAVGNPARREFFAQAPPQARFDRRPDGANQPPRLLVLGGSQGARILNQIVPRGVGLLPPPSRPRVVHQCGRGRAQETQRAYREAGIDESRFETSEFLTDVAAQMAAADFVVSRAGASTLSELAAVGCAALLAPYPFAGGHQIENARFFADRGAARMATESDFSPAAVADFLAAPLADLRALGDKMRAWATPDAAREAASICLTEARRAR